MSFLPNAAIEIMRNSFTLTGRRPRLVVTDLGSEFNNRKVEQYCQSRGIKLQPAPPRVKELNGVAEKSVDTVKNHVRTMLKAAGIQGKMYNEKAITHHVYLWNRTHIGRYTGKTPYEAMTKRQPSVMNVGVFGCDVYVAQHRSQRDTSFSAKAEPGIYLGHDSRSNCSRVLMLTSGKFILTKDVRFREGSFSHLRALQQDRADEVEADESVESEANDPLISDINTKEDKATAQSSVSEQKYDVSKLMGKRIHRGEQQYLVKWSGYSTPTWESAVTLKQDAPDMVKAYDERVAEAHTSTRITRSQARAATEANSVSSTAHSDDATDSAIGLAAMEAASCL
jgi:hypothetical protein